VGSTNAAASEVLNGSAVTTSLFDEGGVAVEQATNKNALENANRALEENQAACKGDKTKCDSDKEKELQKALKIAQENVAAGKLAGKTDAEKSAEKKEVEREEAEKKKKANKKAQADATKALKDYEALCKTNTTKCDSDKEKELKDAVDVAQETVEADTEAEDTEAPSSKSSGDGGMVGLAVGIVVFLVVCIARRGLGQHGSSRAYVTMTAQSQWNLFSTLRKD
jgi:ABC-type Na+ efflux pump permease subunit